MNNNYHVVIPCAGSGSRFGSDIPKQHVQLLDKTVLDWTLLAFIDLYPNLIKSINVIYNPSNSLIADYIKNYPQINFIACGGDSRAQSVLNGLHSITDKLLNSNDWVLVHDAARCLIDTRDIASLIAHAEEFNNGCILATKAVDTIKQVHKSNKIEQTLNRENIYLAQTPQLFQYEQLLQALVYSDLANVTDESSAIELYGGESHVVIPKYPNFKITYLSDIKLAEIILSNRLQGKN